MSLYTALTQCVAVLVKQRDALSDTEDMAEIEGALIAAQVALRNAQMALRDAMIDARAALDHERFEAQR